jgi:hypothetical protein
MLLLDIIRYYLRYNIYLRNSYIYDRLLLIYICYYSAYIYYNNNIPVCGA